MATNNQLEDKELILLLITLLKIRTIFFNCTRIEFDPHSSPKPETVEYNWKGERGTISMLKEIEKVLAIIRLHINNEETIRLYEVMGLFDTPEDIKDFFN